METGQVLLYITVLWSASLLQDAGVQASSSSRRMGSTASNNFHLTYVVKEHTPPDVIIGNVIRESEVTLDNDASQARLLLSNGDAVYFSIEDSGLLKTSHVTIDREKMCAGQPHCRLTLDVLIMTPVRQLVLKVASR